MSDGPKQYKNIKAEADAVDAAREAKGVNEGWHDTLKRLAAEDPLPDECMQCGGDVEAFIVAPLPGDDEAGGPVTEARLQCQADGCGYEWTWYREVSEE